MARRSSRATITQDELDEPTREHRPRRRKRASFFGLLSVLTGLAAFAVVLRDPLKNGTPYGGDWTKYLYEVKGYPIQAYQVAAAGAVLAGLAITWKLLTGRTRLGWPLLGLLVCGLAAGTQRYLTSERPPGSPEYWVQVHIVEPVMAKLPHAKTDEVVTPAPTTPSPQVDSAKPQT